MILGVNTILLLVVLGILVGILIALRKMYILERKIGAVELMMAKKAITPRKKATKKKRKR